MKESCFLGLDCLGEINIFPLAQNVFHAIHTYHPHYLEKKELNPCQVSVFILLKFLLCFFFKVHPIFCGCYDWHSAVHSHWTLLQIVGLLEVCLVSDDKKSKPSQKLEIETVSFLCSFFHIT
jgi:hypothetical protein